MDATRLFGHIVRDYAREVFQESYDAELLQQKLAAIRVAQERIRTKKREDARFLSRLERMGEFYDKKAGPLPFEKKGRRTGK